MCCALEPGQACSRVLVGGSSGAVSSIDLVSSKRVAQVRGVRVDDGAARVHGAAFGSGRCCQSSTHVAFSAAASTKTLSQPHPPRPGPTTPPPSQNPQQSAVAPEAIVAIQSTTQRGAVVMGTETGRLLLGDARRGVKVDHTSLAHAGGLAAMDARVDMVVTCGYTMRMGHVRLGGGRVG